jgi:hypothetical protein
MRLADRSARKCFVTKVESRVDLVALRRTRDREQVERERLVEALTVGSARVIRARSSARIFNSSRVRAPRPNGSSGSGDVLLLKACDAAFERPHDFGRCTCSSAATRGSISIVSIARRRLSMICARR